MRFLLSMPKVDATQAASKSSNLLSRNFGLSDGRVIDGSRGGNSAHWLNHACVANCEAIEEDGRVFIETLTDIDAGAELFIRYGLTVDGAITDEIRAQYTCYCGATTCTRTMLADAA